MKEILLIGDHIIDEYVFGEVKRISPEAPVPIFRKIRTEVKIGGAGNVADNIRSLDGRVIYFHGNNKRPSIIKTRLIATNQQILRIDNEELINYKYSIEELDELKQIANSVDIIAIQDYGKGIITPSLMGYLKDFTHKMIVDPSPANKDLYKKVKMILPNEEEAKIMTGYDDYITAGYKLANSLETKVLMTRSEKGMMLFDGIQTYDYPTKKVEIRDVTGAGDTVLATICVFLNEGVDLNEAIKYANKAGGIVVKHLGNYCVKRSEL